MVTGCAGFIGSNLAEELLRLGHDVVGIDDMSSGRPENIRGMGMEFHRGSINDAKLLAKAMRDVEFVFHQAAIASVQFSIENPPASNHANVDGTLSVLMSARDAGVRRVMFASSSSVYGNCKEMPVKESAALSPLSPYALTKMTGEKYCIMFNDVFGLETISLRYFNIFGKRQDPGSDYAAAVPRFISLMLKGKRPTIFGDGRQTRDFAHVQDVVQANLLAMRARKSACGMAFNIACQQGTTVNGLVDEINGILGTSIKPKHAGPRQGDVRDSVADIALARKELGYEPKVGLREGLEMTIESFKE
ncbi:MAG: SDR family oxidoreductase [Candidatus Aenigmarchaeota archaeon]|nr:SDR family oxidoreductase [Candidatus Aenigmarchaeota archaeon]